MANREDRARRGGDGAERGARRDGRGFAGRTVRSDGRTVRGGGRRDGRPERRDRGAEDAARGDARHPVTGPGEPDRAGVDEAGRRPPREDRPLRKDRDRVQRERPHRTPRPERGERADTGDRAGTGERADRAWPGRTHRRRDPREAARPGARRPTRDRWIERAAEVTEPATGGKPRPEAPPLPEGLDPRSLDREVRGQLRSLARGIAEQVALRLVAAGELIDVDPETALAHATVARRLASRIPAVREATGLTAYRAGEWKTAIGELRAYHRMSGRLSHLAVLADCERALGRPERAIDIFRTADRRQLSDEEATELLIVAAGARADLGQREAAVAMLQVPQLAGTQPWVARLRYAYADALLAIGRTAEAREWFSRAVDLDPEATTDAAERLLELEGVVFDDEPEFEEEPEAEGEPEVAGRGVTEPGSTAAEAAKAGTQDSGGNDRGGRVTDSKDADGAVTDGDPSVTAESSSRPVDARAPEADRGPGVGPTTEGAEAGLDGRADAATDRTDGESSGSGDASVDEAGDRGYSGDGANPGNAVGGVGPANTMSDVEGAVAYDDDDLEDFDDEDDLDDEDLEDFDDDLDDEDIDDEDDLEDDDFDDDEFDEDDEFDDDEDGDFDDDDLEDDDLDDEFDDDDFDDDELDGEDAEDGARSPR